MSCYLRSHTPLKQSSCWSGAGAMASQETHETHPSAVPATAMHMLCLQLPRLMAVVVPLLRWRHICPPASLCRPKSMATDGGEVVEAASTNPLLSHANFDQVDWPERKR